MTDEDDVGVAVRAMLRFSDYQPQEGQPWTVRSTGNLLSHEELLTTIENMVVHVTKMMSPGQRLSVIFEVRD